MKTLQLSRFFTPRPLLGTAEHALIGKWLVLLTSSLPKLIALFLLATVLVDGAGGAPASISPKMLATPGASAVPAVGLRLWLCSTVGAPASGPVARWADQSGCGNDAVQPEADQQPQIIANQVNGLPVVHFIQDHRTLLNLPDVMAGATAGEAFAVLRKTSIPIVGLWAFGSDMGSRYPENGNWIWDSFAATAMRNEGAPPIDLTSFHLYNVGGDAKVWFQIFNGTSFARETSNTAKFRKDPALGDGQGSYFDGDMAEVLIYDHVLTDAERKAVTDYLMGKYQLSRK
ncbi:MAG: hypothetical protein ABSG50_05465 [Opitutaceae bacterium]|jgi:hypothetical protein